MPRTLLRMLFIDTPSEVLSWLGKQGTRPVAALVVIGIALPWLGTMLKPYVTEAVFVLLCIAFLRVDSAGFKTCIRRPFIVGAATAWTSVAVPVLFGIGCLALGLDRQTPGLFLGLMLQAVASPMMAAPALAALMGLDATLVLVTLITSTALIPITAPLFAHLFVGPTLSISPWLLAVRLFAILAGAALVGFLARRVLGMATIERHNDRINGLNILVLFVFVAALMEKVGDRFVAAPMITIRLAALAFLVFLAVLLLTTLLFLFAGRERALALAFMASQRNMGLMLAATGGALPDLTWLYFALSQFPIYLSPQLLRPIVRLILKLPNQSIQRTSFSRR
ncbi:MAG TPA: Na+-dependent transporter [Thermodesulfobacteriota bacterium]|nr:Na+-dependent transporter [Thermodesulfobacteriota bacterium]